jgi:hypothetical protein
MKRALKWSGIGVTVAAGAVLAVRTVQGLRRRMDTTLARMDRVTADARQAAEKTAEALAHTEDALRTVRRTVS